MTCIGAIKTIDNNGKVTITMGADSYWNLDSRILAEAAQVKILRDCANSMLIGFSGSIRALNLIQNVLPDFKWNDYEYSPEDLLRTSLTPCLIESECKEINLLIAFREQIFLMTADFGIIRCHAFGAIGSGSHFMCGALYATKDQKETRKRLEIGLEAAELFDSNVRKPYQFEEITFEYEKE